MDGTASSVFPISCDHKGEVTEVGDMEQTDQLRG